MKCPNCKTGIIIKSIGQCNNCNWYDDSKMNQKEREEIPKQDNWYDHLWDFHKIYKRLNNY